MKICKVTDSAGALVHFDLDKIILIVQPSMLAANGNKASIFLSGLSIQVSRSDGESILKAWSERQKDLVVQ